MIRKASSDVQGTQKKYAYLCVLGYNDTVFPLLSPDLVDIAYLKEHPVGTIPMMRNVLDSHMGSYRRISENRPFWIKPDARGKTQMAAAFTCAREIARRWLAQQPEDGQALRQECFPPVIINITDAQDNGRGDPIAITEEIRREGTRQGAILIFTCHFTKHMGQSLIFPSTREQVARLDPPYAEQMFMMSSVIPEPLRRNAMIKLGLSHAVTPEARGFIYNADTEVLVNFLHWGTQGIIAE